MEILAEAPQEASDHLVGQAEVDVPAREMYADMLLAEGHQAEALTQYEVALKLSPNRFDGLANAARTAEACGQMDDPASTTANSSKSPITGFETTGDRPGTHLPKRSERACECPLIGDEPERWSAFKPV
jgi:hypothetical protein